MKFTVQIKFGAEKQKIVKFGSDRYLVYIISKKEDPDSMNEFVGLMAKEMTVPTGRFHYKGKEGDSYIFDVD
jgi:hypothetical protein